MFSNDLKVKANALVGQIKDNWGNDVKIMDIDYPDVPFDEFEITALFYGKTYVGFAYDRSTLDIGVKVGKEYIVLNDLTDEPVFRGFKSYLPENLLYNFKVLDKTLQTM